MPVLVRSKHEAALRATLGRWSLRDSPTLLAPGGVWLELALRAQTIASPDPPTAALLGSAQRVARSAASCFGLCPLWKDNSNDIQ